MTYKIDYSHAAFDALSKLPKDTRRRIYKRINRLKEDPFSQIQQLHTGKTKEPLYKLRVGDYRVVMQVMKDVLVILIVHIGPRNTVYRQF